MSRIFEKGFTGSNGRNGKKSTGMGLYLCRRLCEKLGIAIEAESVRGEGTKMILTFGQQLSSKCKITERYIDTSFWSGRVK